MKSADRLAQNSAQTDEVSLPMRLQLFLARCGLASRRSSENYILEGRVSVNGELVTRLGVKVYSSDVVCLDGRPIKLETKKRYVLLNKPVGYVCSLADEKDRPIAADLLKEHFSERLYNVGRLDMFSSGLIIFTNDGGFAKKLSHPSSQVEKEYILETSLSIPRNLGERFEKGIRIDDVFYKCRRAEMLEPRRMRIVLIEGKNREIRRVFEYFEIGIKTLTRVRIGSLSLEGMQAGEFRELSEKEVNSLWL